MPDFSSSVQWHHCVLSLAPFSITLPSLLLPWTSVFDFSHTEIITTICLEIKAHSSIMCLDCLALYFSNPGSEPLLPVSHICHCLTSKRQKCLGHFNCCYSVFCFSHLQKNYENLCWLQSYILPCVQEALWKTYHTFLSEWFCKYRQGQMLHQVINSVSKLPREEGCLDMFCVSI